MPLVVNTNVSSLNAQRYLTQNTNNLSKSLEKLASGFRINRAADDAAGLQLSENLRAQIRGSKKALDNVQDGINVLNIADGALAQITENLQRMRELAVQAANDTYDSNQRTAMQDEAEQLAEDIDRIANATQFNGVNLLDGSRNGGAGNQFIIHLGPNDSSTNDQLDLTFGGATGTTNPFGTATAAALDSGIDSGAIDFSDNSGATTALGNIDEALVVVNQRRGTIGALTNRLEGAANNLMTAVENLSASESRIRNVDVASESANMIRNQILQQASATVLSQANQSPSLALSLLG